MVINAHLIARLHFGRCHAMDLEVDCSGLSGAATHSR